MTESGHVNQRSVKKEKEAAHSGVLLHDVSAKEAF